jgi:hypothetical protein
MTEILAEHPKGPYTVEAASFILLQTYSLEKKESLEVIIQAKAEGKNLDDE